MAQDWRGGERKKSKQKIESCSAIWGRSPVGKISIVIKAKTVLLLGGLEISLFPGDSLVKIKRGFRMRRVVDNNLFFPPNMLRQLKSGFPKQHFPNVPPWALNSSVAPVVPCTPSRYKPEPDHPRFRIVRVRPRYSVYNLNIRIRIAGKDRSKLARQPNFFFFFSQGGVISYHTAPGNWKCR